MRAFVFALLLATTASARTIHWPEVNVIAHLDAAGSLHVREEQRTVFDGDWNGGERKFTLRGRQTLTVERMLRKDGEHEIALTRGDLAVVDHYDLTSSDTLRWRSRLPNDPPFENRELTYVIDYVLANVLVDRGDRTVRLDHDFLAKDRQGDVTRFTLQLTFDPVWRAQPVSLTRGRIPPGETVVVTRDLEWTGTAAPPVERAAPRWAAILVALLFLAGLAWILITFVRDETELGRFASLPEVDPSWIERHVTSPLRPELAGTAMRGHTGADDVGAVLARLTQEGKLESRVERGELFLTRKDGGGLRLFESNLLAQLFFDHSRETSTKAIRNHYRGVGFNPAAFIAQQLEGEVASTIPGWNRTTGRVPWKLDFGLLGIAFVAMIACAIAGGPGDIGYAAIIAMISVVSAVGAGAVAAANRTALTKIQLRATFVLVLLAPILLTTFLCSWYARDFTLHVPALFAVACWVLALAKLTFDLFRTPESPERIAVRKQMLAAKAWFRAQIASASPRLRDEWLPYLIAFGLGRNVDRWFRAHGAPGTAVRSDFTSTGSGSSGVDTPSAPAPAQWTGGGGAFSGGGATGAWAAAASAMAAGVSAPSTSSSSGSSSSSSSSGPSSGGGSMGGW